MFQVQVAGLVFVEVKVKFFDSPRLSLIGFFPWVLISGVCYAHFLQFISFLIERFKTKSHLKGDKL